MINWIKKSLAFMRENHGNPRWLLRLACGFRGCWTGDIDWDTRKRGCSSSGWMEWFPGKCRICGQSYQQLTNLTRSRYRASEEEILEGIERAAKLKEAKKEGAHQ